MMKNVLPLAVVLASVGCGSNLADTNSFELRGDFPDKACQVVTRSIAWNPGTGAWDISVDVARSALADEHAFYAVTGLYRLSGGADAYVTLNDTGREVVAGFERFSASLPAASGRGMTIDFIPFAYNGLQRLWDHNWHDGVTGFQVARADNPGTGRYLANGICGTAP